MKTNEVLAIVGAFALFMVVAIPVAYYKASVQREVYLRQGVVMSTWEIVWGAKPIERYVKEDKNEN